MQNPNEGQPGGGAPEAPETPEEAGTNEPQMAVPQAPAGESKSAMKIVIPIVVVVIVIAAIIWLVI